MGKRRKLYFSEHEDEYCYIIEHHIRESKENGLKEIVLFEAVPRKEDEYFFCEEVEEWYAKGGCGKACIDYSPRNGKGGVCKHWSNVSYERGKKLSYNIETNKFTN